MFGATKYLYIALAVGALVAFTGWKAYGIGKEVERAEWVGKEIKEVVAANALIEKLTNEAREKEALANVMLNNISDNLQRVKDEIRYEKSDINLLANDIASVRWGVGVLNANISEQSRVTASTRECDGETITELSPEVFRFVYDGFGTCDEIVEQLTAAQGVILTDRQICNEIK